MKKALALLMLAGGVGFWYHKSGLPLSGDNAVRGRKSARPSSIPWY